MAGPVVAASSAFAVSPALRSQHLHPPPRSLPCPDAKTFYGPSLRPEVISAPSCATTRPASCGTCPAPVRKSAHKRASIDSQLCLLRCRACSPQFDTQPAVMAAPAPPCRRGLRDWHGSRCNRSQPSVVVQHLSGPPDAFRDSGDGDNGGFRASDGPDANAGLGVPDGARLPALLKPVGALP
ncbi:hypothetical protein XHC_2747 [Xanthomonas hortorum pv. carotae str. M081]|nr:hypothetical protein XHC_2747 [Xanthomonas hortorum pv. carotae str. M081]